MNELHESRKTRDQRRDEQYSHWSKSHETAECAVFEYINTSAVMDRAQINLSVTLVTEYLEQYRNARILQARFHVKGFNYCGAPLYLMDVAKLVAEAAIEEGPFATHTGTL